VIRADIIYTLQLLVAVGIAMIIYSLLADLSGRMTIHHFHSDFWRQLLFLFIKVWVPLLLVSPVIMLAGLQYPFLPGRWRQAVAVHSVIFFSLTLLHAAILSYHYHYFAEMDAEMRSYKPWQHMGHFMFGDALILFDMIVYGLLVASTNLRHFYLVVQAKDVAANELNHQLTRTRLQALRMQINPHFLFNTLNAISVLVMKQKTEQAINIISRLSYLFRQSLDENQLLIPLEKELDTAQQYLEIEKVRFGERLDYHIHLPVNLLSYKIPPMLLQPLLENAVHHGLGGKELGGKISIECKKIPDALYDGIHIRITDDGVGFMSTSCEGIGVANVRQRLASYYRDKYTFLVKSEPGKGTEIIIEFPAESYFSTQSELPK
jgi:signal transduction histidine kinase